jgi:hypothetical protein
MENDYDIWCENIGISGYRKVSFYFLGFGVFICMCTFFLSILNWTTYDWHGIKIARPYGEFFNSWLWCFVSLAVAVVSFGVTFLNVMRHIYFFSILLLSFFLLYFAGSKTVSLISWHKSKLSYIREMESKCYQIIRPYLENQQTDIESTQTDTLIGILKGPYCIIGPNDHDWIDKQSLNDYGFVLKYCPVNPISINSIKHLVFYYYTTAESNTYEAKRSGAPFFTEEKIGTPNISTSDINVVVIDFQSQRILHVRTFAPPPLKGYYGNNSYPELDSYDEFMDWTR